MFMKCLCLTYLSSIRWCRTSADTHWTHCLCRLFRGQNYLKISAKNYLKKYFSFQKKKILGEFSHVFHTVYVLYGTEAF